MQRNLSLGKKHNQLLNDLAKELDIPFSQVVGRALELLEEKQAEKRRGALVAE